MQPQTGPLMRLSGVSMTYKSKRAVVAALRDINFELAPSEFVTVTGPSGSGKSTFLQICGGVLSPTTGEVYFKGERMVMKDDLRLSGIRNSSIGFVFQFFHLMDYLTALENVGLPLIFQGMPIKERAERSMELLIRMGLSDRASHYPGELSGGERQRVAIARALVTRPDLIIADEPTGNLDQENGEMVMAALKDINSSMSTAILLVTHNPWVAGFGSRTVRMDKGGMS